MTHQSKRVKERHRAARIAERGTGLRIQLALRRTERRIDLGDHGPKSVVVALTYVLLGLTLPFPVLQFVPDRVSPIVPLMRVGSSFCLMLACIALAALFAARRKMRRTYAEHSSWRILSQAAAAHGRH